jgi:hypothetical protein
VWPEYLVLLKNGSIYEHYSLVNLYMPQIDFGRAFTAKENNATSASASQNAGRNEFTPTAVLAGEPVKLAAGNGLSRVAWVNIIFAAVTFIGGLFCAFYSFNGNELLRAAAAWTGEFLYPRPATITLSREMDHSGEYASEPSISAARSADQGGDPFSQTSGLLTLTPRSIVVSSGAGAGLPSTATLPNARSPLRQISFPPPGGDALTQSFNRAVAELGQVSAPHVGLTQPAARKSENRTTDVTIGRR